jgi:hypothetical protein
VRKRQHVGQRADLDDVDNTDLDTPRVIEQHVTRFGAIRRRFDRERGNAAVDRNAIDRAERCDVDVIDERAILGVEYVDTNDRRPGSYWSSRRMRGSRRPDLSS